MAGEETRGKEGNEQMMDWSYYNVILIQEFLTAQKPLSGIDQEQKRVLANRAYQQWLVNKKVEEQHKNKEEKIEHEIKALQEEQRKTEQKKGQINFLSWKRQKDMEKQLKPETGHTFKMEHSSREQTAPLPGYCSVWSCDEVLAEHMLARVHRGNS